MSATVKTLGEALADPNSSIHAKLQRAREIRKQNAQVIARLVAAGMTPEEAWAEALKTASA